MINRLSVEDLGKCYYITKGADKAGPTFSWKTLKNFAGLVKSLPGLLFGERGPSGKEFWALRRVSFTVEPGKILGVIGANGAGKSTLLKIIARVTPPTEGRVHGSGRVVSLLELGAGFNPESSARENIYLNAALYGIPKSEVDLHFDEIVAFAEIEEFIDTELKFFSSGMYLRLAFSVAVNMAPSILLADEILAVGDIAFQERCLQRVTELARNGLTVLFVSHDMEAVSRICDRVVWLNAGTIVKDGDPEEVVTEYQNAAWARADAAKVGGKGRHENRFAELIGARLLTSAGKEIGAAPQSDDVFIRIRFEMKKANVKIRCGIDLTHRSALIFRSMDPEDRLITEPGPYEEWARIPKHFLTEMTYGVNAFVIIIEDSGKESSVIIYNALSFMSYSGEEAEGRRQISKGGLLAPRLEWTMVTSSEVSNA